MDKKWIIVFIGLILVVGGWIYLHTKEPTTNLLVGRERVGYEEFKKEFLNAKRYIIIMDVRGIRDPERRNVFQCGTDLAGSQGLAGKEKVIMAFDNGECTMVNKTTSIDECLKLIKGKDYIIYITAGKNTSEFFRNMLYIEEGKSYVPCRISYSIT